jgi:hypothetical protein
MSHIIRFPIGDWSDDGHGKCEYFLVTSNMSVDKVRDIHHNVKSILGFDISDICCDHEDSELSLDIFDKLKAADYSIEWDTDDEAMGRYFSSEHARYMGPEEVFNLWIGILMFVCPDLVLIPCSIDYDDIHFYGTDEQGRHINSPGYGCFYL